jgi:hypothetical protein
MKKGITCSQIEQTIAMTEKVGIPFPDFIIGLPGDNMANFKNCIVLPVITVLTK